eukprot:COSAG03_NODE_12453_length_547_cov_0.870536_1_plen_72_part_01
MWTLGWTLNINQVFAWLFVQWKSSFVGHHRMRSDARCPLHSMRHPRNTLGQSGGLRCTARPSGVSLHLSSLH